LPHRIETARLNRSPGSHKGQGLLAVGADHSQLNSGLNPRSRLTAKAGPRPEGAAEL
jgi:hypothetical protein